MVKRKENEDEVGYKDESYGINIQIYRNIYAKSDSKQFILYEKGNVKKGDNTGKEKTTNLGYFSTFPSLVMFTYDYLVKTSGAQTIQELKEIIESIHKEIIDTLDFRTNVTDRTLKIIKDQLNKRTDI